MKTEPAFAIRSKETGHIRVQKGWDEEWATPEMLNTIPWLAAFAPKTWKTRKGAEKNASAYPGARDRNGSSLGAIEVFEIAAK